MVREMREMSSGDFPWQKITSGKPQRSARWESTLALGSALKGRSFSSRSAASTVVSPAATPLRSRRTSSSVMAVVPSLSRSACGDGVGIEGEIAANALLEEPETQPCDHRAVVRAQPQIRVVYPVLFPGSERVEPLAEAAVGRDPAADDRPLESFAAQRAAELLEENVHHCLLERRRQIREAHPREE